MSLLRSLFGPRTQYAGSIKRITPSEFSKSITGRPVQLIDVRTPLEFKGGHLKNARNIDIFQSGTFVQKMNQLDMKKPVYVYCRSGNRSLRAAKWMLKMGFTEVYDLKGGYLSWNYSHLKSTL